MVYVLEDDDSIRKRIEYTLKIKELECVSFSHPEEFWMALAEKKPSLILLDIMLPDEDGISILKKLREAKETADIPVIMLTAKYTEFDIVTGLDSGADDYITKPFSMDELLMRIHAVYNRSSLESPAPTTYKLGSFIFDAPRHLLIKGEETRKLTSKEADLLLLLCENMNETLERTEALRKVWYEDSYFNARSMDVYITKLRKYFKDEPDVELLNVHGVGFKLLVKN